MAYNSAHTGPQIDAAVQLLGQVQEARDATSQDLADVKDLASEVKNNANQVATQAETVNSKSAQVVASAQAVEHAREEVSQSTSEAEESKSEAALSASSAQESQQAARASELAAAQSQLQAGLSEQVSAEHAAETVAAADKVASDSSAAKASAESAAISARNAAAVVTGGTASIAPSPGKIPLADAGGKIDSGWLPTDIARSAAVDEVAQVATAAADAAAEAQSRTAAFLLPSPEAPAARDDGSPLQVSDRYTNSVDQVEYIFRAGGWEPNDSLVAIAALNESISTESTASGIPRAGADGKIDMGWLSELVAETEDLDAVSDALQEYIRKVSSTEADGGLGLLKFSQEINYPAQSFGARMRKKVLVTDLPFNVKWDDESFDNSPGFQQAINYCIANKLNLHVPKPKTFYAFRSMQGTNAVLRIPAGGIVITGDLGEMRNFCNAHFIDGDVGANDIDISGLYLNHNAQALDDLSQAAIDALDPAVYPNKAYSGYGTETPNNVFGKMFQYAGWPFGVTPDGTTRFAIRFRGDRCFAHRNIVKRAQVVAIRYSDGAKHGAAFHNLILESRFNGVNFSSDTFRCMAANNVILDTLQIGVAVFSPGTALSDHHAVTDNLIVNTKPLGENGIEIVGTDPGMIEGGTTTGNTILGFGSCGIRTVRMKGGCIIGNRVKGTCLLSIQQARYPNSADGTGIFLHEYTQDCVVLGNSVSGSRNVGIRSANDLNTVGTNCVTESGGAAVLINNVPYAANDLRANSGFFKRRLYLGDSVSDVELGAVAGASLVISTDFPFVRLVSGTTYSVVDIATPVASGAVLEIIKTTGVGTVTLTHTNNLSLKGAASVALTVVGSSIRLAYVAGKWREMARNL